MYLNKIQLYGNLTRDPEIRALPSGQQVVNFSLATNRTYRDKDKQKQEQTEYHNVVAFGRTAEVIGQYVKKGRPLYVEGRLQTRSWDKDGVKQFRTEVVVEQFQFGASSGAADGDSRTSAPDAYADQPLNKEFEGEDINPEDIPC